ncbi:MAG: hypothetical protein JWO57_3216 [Pseudonocardiales bacterium]|nr:hypothetical protein [Pseudonocardiales bacterium]
MVGDPRDDAIINAFDRRIDALISEFGQRHDVARRDNAEIKQRITELAESVTRLGRRMDDIERKAGYKVLYDQAKRAAESHTQERFTSGLWASRPLAIDEACAAEPGKPQMVLIPELGLEIEPEPDSDPEVVWLEAQRAISAAVAGGGKKRRR